MNKAGYDTNGQMGWVEVPDPVAFGPYAVIETTVVPICTEYRYHNDGVHMARVGHEAVGRVIAVPDRSHLELGMRVVVMPTWPCSRCRFCRSGNYVHCASPELPWENETYTSGADTLAERLIKPDWLLVPIPDDVDDELASMVLCGLGPTFGAMQTLDVSGDMTILVMGLGPVGLGGVVNGIDRGARVIAAEPNAERRRLGEQLGAEVVSSTGDAAVAEIKDMTEGIGPDAVVECTGVEAARRVGVEAVRSLGSVAFVGEGGDLTVHVSDELIRTGKRLLGSWHYNLNDTEDLFDVVRRQSDRVQMMITHRFPMDSFLDAWEAQRDGTTGKVLLTT